MFENTLSFLWLIAALLVPVVLIVRSFVVGGWLVATLEGRGPCTRVERREGCRCNHCRGRCLCASRAAAEMALGAGWDQKLDDALPFRAPPVPALAGHRFAPDAASYESVRIGVD